MCPVRTGYGCVPCKWVPQDSPSLPGAKAVAVYMDLCVCVRPDELVCRDSVERKQSIDQNALLLWHRLLQLLSTKAE